MTRYRAGDEHRLPGELTGPEVAQLLGCSIQCVYTRGAELGERRVPLVGYGRPYARRFYQRDLVAAYVERIDSAAQAAREARLLDQVLVQRRAHGVR